MESQYRRRQDLIDLEHLTNQLIAEGTSRARARAAAHKAVTENNARWWAELPEGMYAGLPAVQQRMDEATEETIDRITRAARRDGANVREARAKAIAAAVEARDNLWARYAREFDTV